MAKGRWEKYAEETGIAIGEFFNRNMREVLRIGIKAVVENTYMDSGRAAAHWTVIPNKGNSRPGAWGQMKFPNPDYGTAPVGYPGDKAIHGGSSPAVIKAVVEREWARSITRAIQGRRPATVFTFHSSVPTHYDDGSFTFGGTRRSNYRENAKLEEAKQAGLTRMREKFINLHNRGDVRKIPLR